MRIRTFPTVITLLLTLCLPPGAAAQTSPPSPAQDAAASAPMNPRSMIRLKVPGQKPPIASLADMGWLQGHWVGQMPEGPVEHYTMSPMFGHMPAFVRATDRNGVIFYEISLIAEVGGSLTVRVKHFTSALAGGEAQNAYVDRPLVARDATNLYFDGVTYSRTGPDTYVVYFLNRSGNDERETIVVPFRRK